MNKLMTKIEKWEGGGGKEKKRREWGKEWGEGGGKKHTSTFYTLHKHIYIKYTYSPDICY